MANQGFGKNYKERRNKMKKFTFMIRGYENYDPSDYEYMYDEDRLWELSYDVIASSKEEALNNLLKDSYAKDRKIIDEDGVKILRIFGNPENYHSDECTEYTYLIVSIKDVRPGVDFVEEDIFVTEETFSKNKWCSDGLEKTTTYFFNDGFKIVKISNSAPGWSEGKTLLIVPDNKTYTLYTYGEDVYNQGDKKINESQALRYKAISTHEKIKSEIKRKFDASMRNTIETSRLTFLDREMPYLVA